MITNQEIKSQLYPNFHLNFKYYDQRSIIEENELTKFNSFITKKTEIDNQYKKQLEQLTEQMLQYQKQLIENEQHSILKDKLEHLINLWDIQQNQLAGFNSQVQDTIISHNNQFLAQQKQERKQFQSCSELDNILRENIERVQSTQKDYQQFIYKSTKQNEIQKRSKEESSSNLTQKTSLIKKLEYEYDQYNLQLDNLFTQYNSQEETLLSQQYSRRQQVEDTVMRYIVFMIGYLKNQQYDVDRIITRFQSTQTLSQNSLLKYIDQDIQAKYIITKIYLKPFLQKVDRQTEDNKVTSTSTSPLDTFTRKFSMHKKDPIQMIRTQERSMKTTTPLHSIQGDQSIDSDNSNNDTAYPKEDNKILVNQSQHTNTSHLSNEKRKLAQEITRTMDEMKMTEKQLNRKHKEIEQEISHLVSLLFNNSLQQEQLGILLQFVDFDSLDYFLNIIDQHRFQEYMEDTPFHQLGSLFQTLTLYIQKNSAFIKHKLQFSNQAVQAVIKICNMSKQSFRKNNTTIYQLYIAQVLNYDLSIYKRFFLQNFQNIFEQKIGNQDQLVSDQVSFLIYIGLNYQQLESCLSQLKERDNSRFKQIMNSANVQFLNTNQMLNQSIEQNRTSVIRNQIRSKEKDKWRT